MAHSQKGATELMSVTLRKRWPKPKRTAETKGMLGGSRQAVETGSMLVRKSPTLRMVAVEDEGRTGGGERQPTPMSSVDAQIDRAGLLKETKR